MDKDKHTNHAAEQETESSWDFERKRIAFIQNWSEKKRKFFSEMKEMQTAFLADNLPPIGIGQVVNVYEVFYDEITWQDERRFLLYEGLLTGYHVDTELGTIYYEVTPFSDDGQPDGTRKELIKAYFIPPYRLRVEIKS